MIRASRVVDSAGLGGGCLLGSSRRLIELEC